MPLGFAAAATLRASAALRESATLLVNSGALVIGTVTTAALGFVYWWLAARLFPPEAIGQASALLSVMGLVGLMGEAGLGTLLIGEIGRHRDQAAGLAGSAACVGGALALGLALAFILAAPRISFARLFEGWPDSVAFVFGCCLTALNAIALQALVGHLNGIRRMLQQILFSALKLALIAGVAAARYESSCAILLTWVIGLLASWIGFDLATRGGARLVIGSPDFGLLHALRCKVLDHYALDIGMQAPGLIMPYLVLVVLSPTTNAAFAALWMLINMASVLPAVAATTLFPVVRANPTQSRHDIIVSLTASLLFSLICAVFVLAYSRQILGLFNPLYPDIAGSNLRFLGFSLLGSTFKYHVCALARLGDWMRKASLCSALGGALEVCLAVAGAKLDGLSGLVMGWTLAVSIEGACAAFVLVAATKRGAARSTSSPGPALSGWSPLRQVFAWGSKRGREEPISCQMLSISEKPMPEPIRPGMTKMLAPRPRKSSRSCAPTTSLSGGSPT